MQRSPNLNVNNSSSAIRERLLADSENDAPQENDVPQQRPSPTSSQYLACGTAIFAILQVKLGTTLLNDRQSHDDSEYRGQVDATNNIYNPPRSVSQSTALLTTVASIFGITATPLLFGYGLYNIGKGEYLRGLKWTALGAAMTAGTLAANYYSYQFLSECAGSSGYQSGYDYQASYNNSVFVPVPTEPSQRPGQAAESFKIIELATQSFVSLGAATAGFFSGRKAKQLAEERSLMAEASVTPRAGFSSNV